MGVKNFNEIKLSRCISDQSCSDGINSDRIPIRKIKIF